MLFTKKSSEIFITVQCNHFKLVKLQSCKRFFFLVETFKIIFITKTILNLNIKLQIVIGSLFTFYCKDLDFLTDLM